MKIGICCNVFGPSGGMERYTLDITKSFLERGHQVEIFTKKAYKETLSEFSIPVHLCNLSIVPGKLRDYLFSLWLLRARKKYSVDALIGCCRNTVSEVAICGGTHIGFLQALKRAPKLSDRLAIHIEKQCYSNAKIVVPHSNLMENELRTLYHVPKSKIRTLYPPSSLEHFSPCSFEKKSDLRRRFHFPNDKKIFLFVSSSHERKGFPLLREFFESTDLPIELVVAGRPIPSRLKNIRYIGFSDKIEELYQAADCSILASLYEPFGLAAVESVMCGTPVILANNIGSSEIIPGNLKFEFEKNNLSSLKSAIECFLSQPTPDCAEQFQFRDLSINTHVSHLEKIIREILSPI